MNLKEAELIQETEILKIKRFKRISHSFKNIKETVTMKKKQSKFLIA